MEAREPATCENLIVEACQRPTSGVFVSTAGASPRLETLVPSISWKVRLFVAGPTRVSACIQFPSVAGRNPKQRPPRVMNRRVRGALRGSPPRLSITLEYL